MRRMARCEKTVGPTETLGWRSIMAVALVVTLLVMTSGRPAALGSFHTEFRAPIPSLQGSGLGSIGLVTVKGDPYAEQAVRGATIALDEVNAGKGFDEQPIRLEVGETTGAWSTVSETCRDLVYERECLAVLSVTSGEVAHLLAQIAMRGRVPVATLSSEGSLTRIPAPWLFRMVPDRPTVIRALLGAMSNESRVRGIATVVSGRREERICREDLRTVQQAATTCARAAASMETSSAPVLFNPILTVDDLRDDREGAWADSRELLVLSTGTELRDVVVLLSERRWQGTLFVADIFAGESLVNAAYGDIAFVTIDWIAIGRDPEGMSAFSRTYERSHHESPGAAAWAAYDAVLLFSKALRAEGRNPAAVRDWLASPGSTSRRGTTFFDGSGNRLGDVTVARFTATEGRNPSIADGAIRRQLE